MATLTVRDLPDDVRDKLRVRAAQHGRSMEAEVRAVLADTVAGATLSGMPGVRERVERLQQAFEPHRDSAISVADELIAERRNEAACEDRIELPVAHPVQSQREKLAEARAILRQYVPEGTPLVDQFLADRRRMWGEE